MNVCTRYRFRAALLLAMTALVISPAHAGERIRAGLWEMTTTQGGQPINSGTHCVTPEVAASSNADQQATHAMLQALWAKANCTLTDLAVTDGTLSYAVDCPSGPNPHSMSSASKYHGGDTFETELISKHQGVVTDMITKGRRIGSCP